MSLARSIAILLTSLFVLGACSKEEQSNAIKVAVSPAVPPMLFEKDGKYTGIDLEIFEGYCQSRGCTFKMTAYDWLGMLGAVTSGQADVAFSGISITDKRKEVMDFSNPYFTSTWQLIGLKNRHIKITDLSQLKKYTIAYPTGSVFDDYVKTVLQPKGYYSVDQVKLYPSPTEALIALQNGNVDLVFVDSESTKNIYVEKYGFEKQEQDKNKFSEEEVEIIIQKLMGDIHCGDLCYGDNVIDFKLSPRQWLNKFLNK